MIQLPKSINLANLPTKIEKLERFSKYLGGPNIYIKRDDQTGMEISGNKIRKLEFAVKEALDQGCNLLITCGGIQSNHARATAAVAAKLGIHSYLVLMNDGEEKVDGNYFLDRLLGANIRYITRKDYIERRMEIMEEIKEEMSKKGYKPYIIPMGASNGIGTFGYYKAMEEIIAQEKEMGIDFDLIVATVGSGGTYGGLFLANKIHKHKSTIYGVSVSNDAEYFKSRVNEIIHESLSYMDVNIEFSKEEMKITDEYAGRGYALNRTEEIEFIYEFAKLEGIILDPVYTGKAMYGLSAEIKKGNLKAYHNILFIHTGGLFGLFPKKELLFK